MSDTLHIRVVKLGELDTNCYIIWSANTHQGYVVDPADDGATISQVVLDEGIMLQAILLTHGHFDHLLALLELQLNFPVPVLLHPDDLFLLNRAQQTAVHFLGRSVDPVPQQTQPLENGTQLPIGSNSIQVLHTPGHTPGSVSLLLKPNNTQLTIDHNTISNSGVLLTGDTLFSYGIEPLTHQYSNALHLSISLQTLRSLEENTLILPGHGDPESLTAALQATKK